jgi:hypothetical protein
MLIPQCHVEWYIGTSVSEEFAASVFRVVKKVVHLGDRGSKP